MFLLVYSYSLSFLRVFFLWVFKLGFLKGGCGFLLGLLPLVSWVDDFL